MQASLFEESKASGEDVTEINAEILREVELRYPDRIFILGTGEWASTVMVIGESPGPPDVETGKPFSGPSGELLRKILSSIGVEFDDCYLTNVVKFISRGEEITQETIAFFAPFVHREILAVSPEVIIVLGNTAARGVLGTKKPISKIRGEVFEFHGIKAVATFNPAYLLRDPTKKREVWDDMKKVREILEMSARVQFS
jgi:uracil-DNA glycosylase family 4